MSLRFFRSLRFFWSDLLAPKDLSGPLGVSYLLFLPVLSVTKTSQVSQGSGLFYVSCRLFRSLWSSKLQNFVRFFRSLRAFRSIRSSSSLTTLSGLLNYSVPRSKFIPKGLHIKIKLTLSIIQMTAHTTLLALVTHLDLLLHSC